MYNLLCSMFHNLRELEDEKFQLTRSLPNYGPTWTEREKAKARLELLLSKEAKEAFLDYCEAQTAFDCVENDAAFLTGVNFCATLMAETFTL